MDCTLPVTGSTLALLPLAAVALVAGATLAFIGRRWGLRGGVAAIVVFALAFIGLGAHSADAQTPCPETTTAPATTPATVESSTVAPPTTVAGATTTATTVASTASTSATTTISGGGGSTGPTATSTITSAPDLTVTILGPTSLASGTISQNTLTIRNVGTASTTGTMTFTLTELPSGIATYPTSMTSSDWAATRTATGWTFTSVPSLVLAPGAQSTISFGLSVPAPGTSTSLTLTAQLPPGIGGETNSSNNTAQLAVSLT